MAGQQHRRADRGGDRRRRDPAPLPAGAAGRDDPAPDVRDRAVRRRPDRRERGRAGRGRPRRPDPGGAGAGGPRRARRAPPRWSTPCSNGLELRVAEELPIKLVLADADLALVPLTLAAAGEPGAVLLQRSGLRRGAGRRCSRRVWRGAYPLELSEPRAAAPDDERGGRGRPDRSGPADPQPAAGRPHRPGRRHPAGPLPADRPAPAAPPPGPGRRADPDAAGLVRRPARLGLGGAVPARSGRQAR